MSSVARQSPTTRLEDAADADARLGTDRRRKQRSWLRRLLANPITAISFAFLVLAFAVGLLAPLIAPGDPNFAVPADRLKSPGGDYPLGSDALGRDVFDRLIHGTRISLLIGVGVTFAAGVFGSVLGLLSGYIDRLDSPIMRTMDGLMAFPSILLAIAIMASLGPRTSNVIVALAVVYVPQIARLVRGTTLGTRGQLYVESARVIGAKDGRILGRYILANSLSPLIVQCTFIFAYAIIAEASLSFLGAGVPPEVPTWGNMLRDGQRLITTSWWLSIMPGTMLFVTVLTLNLLGDGLRDALDPRSQER